MEGHEARSQADKISAIIDTVDTNYFETAGVVLESGREFTNVDQENSMPVAMINEKMAHDYWPRGDALGKRIQLPVEKQMRQIGVLIGFAAALLAGRVINRMLYGVSAGDPVSAAGAAVVLLAVALLACYLPARRASRVDPLVALREG